MEGKDSPWTLKRVMTILKMGSLSASTAISMATWLKNVEIRRKRKKSESVSSVTKKGTLREIVKENS